MSRCLTLGGLFALLLGAGYVWLALWADDRNQRFYMTSEQDQPWWAHG